MFRADWNKQEFLRRPGRMDNILFYQPRSERPESAGAVPGVVMKVDDSQGSQRTQSGRRNGFDEVAIQPEEFEKLQALKSFRLNVSQLAIGHFEPDQFGSGRQTGRLQTGERISVEAELAQFRHLLEGLARNGRQGVVTQVQLDQIGEPRQGRRIDAAE